MLDLLNETALSEETWRQLPSRAELPCSWEDYVTSGGVSHARVNSTRKHCRVSLRSIAIVIDGDHQHAAYAKDVSKCGLGFYSPVHMLPRTIIRLWVPGRALLRLRITRCRRLGERSYECGSVYEAITQGPKR